VTPQEQLWNLKLEKAKAAQALTEHLGAVFPVFGVRMTGRAGATWARVQEHGKHPHSGLVHHGHSEATRDLDVVQSGSGTSRT